MCMFAVVRAHVCDRFFACLCVNCKPVHADFSVCESSLVLITRSSSFIVMRSKCFSLLTSLDFAVGTHQGLDWQMNSFPVLYSPSQI